MSDHPTGSAYIFQRPESHCVHHQEGLHSFNYADLPLWDMLFGTFRNPKEWQSRCGFGALNIVSPKCSSVLISTRSLRRRIRVDEPRSFFLFVIGSLQMSADLLRLPALKAVAAATGASPVPLVFSSVQGLETFSSVFFVEWRDRDGRAHSAELTPENDSRLRGPDNTAEMYSAPRSRMPPYFPLMPARHLCTTLLSDMPFAAPRRSCANLELILLHLRNLLTCAS